MQIGYTRVVADGVVGVSGDAVAIYGVWMESGAGGAGSVVLRNGSSASGDEIIGFIGSAADARQTFEVAGGAGVVFSSGCFIDIGTNTDAVTVFYTKVGS